MLFSRDRAAILGLEGANPPPISFSKTWVEIFANAPIDDCAKDGGEEFFTNMHCVL